MCQMIQLNSCHVVNHACQTTTQRLCHKVTQTNNCWKLEQTTLDQINIKIETTIIENDINYWWQKALMKRVFALTFIKLL